MICGDILNITSDISKLLYVILWAVRRVIFETIWNITGGVYAKYQVQIMLLFVYTTSHKRFVIFTCRYFKLSWNTTALSQSHSRNFSCSGIVILIRKIYWILIMYSIYILNINSIFKYKKRNFVSPSDHV